MQENEKKEPCCCCAHKTKHRSEEEYKSLVHRLNRIEGQIRGIRGMVENEVYCPDILVQSAAVTAAMNAFNRELLANHIRTCVADDIRAGNDEVVDELLNRTVRAKRRCLTLSPVSMRRRKATSFWRAAPL